MFFFEQEKVEDERKRLCKKLFLPAGTSFSNCLQGLLRCLFFIQVVGVLKKHDQDPDGVAGDAFFCGIVKSSIPNGYIMDVTWLDLTWLHGLIFVNFK